MGNSETFVINTIPETVAQLQALPEASLDSPFKATALALVALLKFDVNPQSAYDMLDFLKGPDSVSPYEKQFIRDRLSGKQYKVNSFFAGATVNNNYTPTVPYTITVSDNPYSYSTENYATMYVQSSGADSPRPVKLRKKPSTGQWFVTDIQCLSDIRIPVEADPWA